MITKLANVQRARGAAMLAVVGIGIQCAGQTTHEARRAIETADIVLFGVADARAAAWLRSLNPNAESFDYAHDGRTRRAIYRAMADRVLQELALGKRVCAVFYGSPSTLTQPAQQAVELAQSAGYPARIFPAVSFLECLFVDLQVDAAAQGCQILEGSAWLLSGRSLDPYAHIVLTQPAAIGARGLPTALAKVPMRRALSLLTRCLMQSYPSSHDVVVYEAASEPLQPFRAERMALVQLPDAHVSERSTLYIPPIGQAPIDPQRKQLLERLASATDD
jgi:uncharacterized protein YabN with tetrapyrrole methylase and pyrophosphatase domain